MSTKQTEAFFEYLLENNICAGCGSQVEDDDIIYCNQCIGDQ